MDGNGNGNGDDDGGGLDSGFDSGGIAAAAASNNGEEGINDHLNLPDISLKGYEVEQGVLKMKVFLRKDKRFKYVRIYDFLYEAFIESNEELEKVTPSSPILIDLRLLVEKVRERERERERL
jgi:flavin-dependent dehydrogenase